jgi:hypothetical protein
MEVYGLDEFVGEVRHVVSTQMPPGKALKTLSPGFSKLLANRAFLTKKLATIQVQEYETCLYRDPVHEFVVLARGVRPRNSPYPILPHDHGPLWALYGVYGGKVTIERYKVNPVETGGQYPGLSLVSSRLGEPGDFDAIPPHHLHCPPDEEEGSLTIVVYPKDLDKVTRRGYMPEIKALIEFQGKKPPRTISAVQT